MAALDDEGEHTTHARYVMKNHCVPRGRGVIYRAHYRRHEEAASGDNERDLSKTLPTMRVNRPNGAEVRCRLACKGCYQEAIDMGDTYASTPCSSS